MKITATITGKILFVALAGWLFGVFVSKPFVEDNDKKREKQIYIYKLVQQNANWNKQNTVYGLDKIKSCDYIYEDVTHNPTVKCKLPCITLYKYDKPIYRWEANIMMRNNVTVRAIKSKMK